MTCTPVHCQSVMCKWYPRCCHSSLRSLLRRARCCVGSLRCCVGSTSCFVGSLRCADRIARPPVSPSRHPPRHRSAPVLRRSCRLACVLRLPQRRLHLLTSSSPNRSSCETGETGETGEAHQTALRVVSLSSSVWWSACHRQLARSHRCASGAWSGARQSSSAVWCSCRLLLLVVRHTTASRSLSSVRFLLT